MASPIALVLLSGIPASGKTTLGHLFKDLVQQIPLKTNTAMTADHVYKTTEVIHISYDLLIGDNLQFDEETPSWKQYRRHVHSCVEQMLCYLAVEKIPLEEAVKKISLSGSTDVEEEISRVICSKFQNLLHQQMTTDNLDQSVVFILDDNFFYRSMRYEYFQLARKYSIGFCEVYITCPVGVASSRNSHRSKPVSEETYAAMMTKIEPPCSIKAPWETDYIVVDGGADFDHLDLSEMWGLVTDSLQNPLEPLKEEDLEEKAKSRAISLTNILHQADIILRKCVSESIKEGTSSGGERTVHVKSLAETANKTRTALLNQIREGAITLPQTYKDGSTTDPPGGSKINEAFMAEIRRLYQEAVLT